MGEDSLGVNKFNLGCEREFNHPDIERENTSYHSAAFQTFENIYTAITTILVFSTNILLIIALAASKFIR